MQAIAKLLVMLLVNWYYALTCFLVVFVVWFYVGTANPAVKPGLTAEFNFFGWLKSVIFRCFGYVIGQIYSIVMFLNYNIYPSIIANACTSTNRLW